jgi:hypothetical protein
MPDAPIARVVKRLRRIKCGSGNVMGLRRPEESVRSGRHCLRLLPNFPMLPTSNLTGSVDVSGISKKLWHHSTGQLSQGGVP